LARQFKSNRHVVILYLKMGAYLPILLALNLVLLISSTAMLYLGSILVNFYLLPSLSLVSSHFATVPYLTEVNNCGLGTGEGIFQDLYPGHSIFTHGCLTILEGRLERDVEPVLIAYIGCAVVLALLQILGLVLAAAYVAAITRKMKPEGDRRGMYQHPGQAYPGTVGYEESLYNRTKPYSDTIDSGITGSLRSTKSSRSNVETELKGSATPLSVRRLEDVLDASHRSSIYIEPSNEEGTQI